MLVRSWSLLDAGALMPCDYSRRMIGRLWARLAGVGVMALPANATLPVALVLRLTPPRRLSIPSTPSVGPHRVTPAPQYQKGRHNYTGRPSGRPFPRDPRERSSRAAYRRGSL